MAVYDSRNIHTDISLEAQNKKKKKRAPLQFQGMGAKPVKLPPVRAKKKGGNASGY